MAKAQKGIKPNDIPSPGLTDEEELTPEEQAMLDAGTETAPAPAAEPAEELVELPGDEDEGLEAPAEDTGEDEEGPEKSERRRNTVMSDLIDERKKVQELKARLLELQEQQKAQEERWNRASKRLEEMQARADAERQKEVGEEQANADPEPDREADPLGHIEWENRQLRQQMTQLNERLNAGTAQSQATAQLSQLQAMEQQWAIAHPDYYQRIAFMRDRRDRELQVMGYSDPAERAQIIATEAGMLVQGAQRRGKHPGEVVQEMSDQWGYGAGQAAPAAATNGHDQIQSLQRKQAAAKSAQGIANRPVQAPMTLEQLAGMEDDDYERYIDKHGGDLQQLISRRQ